MVSLIINIISNFLKINIENKKLQNLNKLLNIINKYKYKDNISNYSIYKYSIEIHINFKEQSYYIDILYNNKLILNLNINLDKYKVIYFEIFCNLPIKINKYLLHYLYKQPRINKCINNCNIFKHSYQIIDKYKHYKKHYFFNKFNIIKEIVFINETMYKFKSYKLFYYNYKIYYKIHLHNPLLYMYEKLDNNIYKYNYSLYIII